MVRELAASGTGGVSSSTGGFQEQVGQTAVRAGLTALAPDSVLGMDGLRSPVVPCGVVILGVYWQVKQYVTVIPQTFVFLDYL